jgi:hypothetical protein
MDPDYDFEAEKNDEFPDEHEEEQVIPRTIDFLKN